MKRIAFIAGLLLALCCPASAQFTGGNSFGTPGFSVALVSTPLIPCTPGTHATTFLARTSGLSPLETNSYCILINGLDTDSTFALLDALWIFATNTTTTANLNLISTSFTVTNGVAPAFTADQGYTGNGTSQYLITGYTPSTAGGHYTLNSASIGSYVRGSRTATANAASIGVSGGGTGADIKPLTTATPGMGTELNGATFPAVTLPSSIAAGFVSLSRTSSTNISAYKNGSSTALASPADTSVSLPALGFFILAANGTGSPTNFSTDPVSAIYIGGGITGAQHLLLANRINAYMTALGINIFNPLLAQAGSPILSQTGLDIMVK